MSAVWPNTFANSNVNATMPMEKPCAPVFISYVYGSNIGWNAALVGLLSSVLMIAFLLTCLYYLLFRRRYAKEMFDESSTVAMVEKNGAAGIPVTSASQAVSTTVLHEPGKETKISTYTEQVSGSVANGDFAITMSSANNGHVSANGSPGLLTNGNADQSELRLLQHEHH